MVHCKGTVWVHICAPCLAAESTMKYNVGKGKLPLWENRSADVPRLNRSSWDQNIVRNIWISLIVQYVGISHSISDYLRYGRDCAAWGERGRGRWDHIWLDQPASHAGVSGEYANANTHPFLWYVAGLNSNFQAAQYLEQTNIDDQLFSQPK